jgi:hypothetical protein
LSEKQRKRSDQQRCNNSEMSNCGGVSYGERTEETSGR